MNKRGFIKSLSFALLGAVARAAAGGAPEAPRRRPKNWVRISKATGRSEADWDRLFGDLHTRGIEAVDLEMYDGRHAYWDSARLPVKEACLETILPVSRRYALEMHAWVHAPEMDRARLRNLVAELADVPALIGVHLDLAGANGDEAAASACRALTAAVREDLVPAARTRGTLLSAAVPASAAPAWSSWPLDAFVAVVDGGHGADTVKSRTAEAVAAVPAPVYCGLSAGILEPDVLARAARAALAGGAAGVSLLDVESMDEARWTAFEQAVALG